MPTIVDCARMRFRDEPSESQLLQFIEDKIWEICKLLPSDGDNGCRLEASKDFEEILKDTRDESGNHSITKTVEKIVSKALDEQDDLQAYQNLRSFIIDKIVNPNRS